ncbi:MAG: TonB-dependent receptor family protein, partial [Bacteroidales bacterium]|nr:TonB-dependent receptor family protein [Bacteroidales bacterium]
MKKLFILSTFQLFFVLSFAQGQFTINGLLKSDTVSVKNAVVKLYQDSVTFAATLSNEQGAFVFENIPQGKYQLQIIPLLYEQILNEIDLTGNYDCGTVQLKQSALLLNEIEIRAEIAPVVMQPNGVTLNVGNTPLADFGSASDLLDYAPVIFVKDNVSQFANGGLQILINGKSVNLTPEQQDNFLKSISARNIEKIEIIDKPDASLEANKYGIVNITLKQTKGFSGDLEAKLMYHKTFFQSYEASFFFNSEKIRLYAILNCDIRTFLFEDKGFENRGFLQIRKKNNSASGATTPTATLGGDYQINEKSSLGFLYSFYWEHQNKSKILDTYTITGENLTADSLINRESNEKHDYFLHTFTLMYYRKTDTLGSSFTTSIDFAPDKQDGQTAFNYSFWRDEAAAIPTQIIDYKQQDYSSNYITSFNAKYNKVFKNRSVFNVGGKFEYTRWHNGWNILNLFNDDYVLDKNSSKNLIFNEFIIALFSGYNFSYKKSYFSISVRYEHNINKYKNNDANYSTAQNWYILPTFLHNITINANNRIYYYFTEKIYRPSYFSYMESAAYNPINQTFGNSKLKPQNQYAFVLGYILRNKYMAALQLIRNENLFLQIPQITDNTLIYNTINGGNSNSIALIVNAPVNIFKWWETSTNFSLSFINRNFKNNSDKYIYNNWQGNISHSSTFRLPKRFFINLGYSYTSKTKTFFYEQADIHKLDAGVGWRINDNFIVNFSVLDILNSVATNTTYNYFDKITGYNNHNQITSRTFWFRIAYSFSVG